MSIRVTACFLFVIFFSIYAWRNWFVSLCAAILLMAVMQHPDMPKNIADIQGLNPWNVLTLNVFLAWWFWRRRVNETWDLPRNIRWLILGYITVVVLSFLRMLMDSHHWSSGEGMTYLISEYFINCLKWLVPGFLLFDGCRTRRRVLIALAAILGVYVLLAVQVIRWMPLSYAVSGGDLSHRASKIIQNEIGYNRVNMSMMLAGASWAILITQCLSRKWSWRLAMTALFLVVALGQALTGGRAGYATWGVLGLLIGALRWRRVLIIIPVVVLMAAIFLPGVRDRMLQGVGGRDGAIVIQESDYEMTSGRSLMWPLVIKKIKEAPLLGWGRMAMKRTGLTDQVLNTYGEKFSHPHNAYLEWLLDNGLLGFLIGMPLFFVLACQSLSLLADREDPICCAVGGATFALIVALMVAAMGSQTFYAREGSVGMWAAIGVMLRVLVERRRARTTGWSLFAEGDAEGEEWGPMDSSVKEVEAFV